MREELNVKSLVFGAPEVKLNTEITEELRLEGLAREVVRAIQDRRKKLGLNVEDRIDTLYEADGMLVRAMQRHADYIKTETLSVSLDQGRADDFNGEQLMLEGEQIWIGLKKTDLTNGKGRVRPGRDCRVRAGPRDQEPGYFADSVWKRGFGDRPRSGDRERAQLWSCVRAGARRRRVLPGRVHCRGHRPGRLRGSQPEPPLD